MRDENLSQLVKTVMGDFPGSVKSFLNVLASPEVPVMNMAVNEQSFDLAQESIAHIGATKLGIERSMTNPLMMDDGVHVIWLKISDPEQKLDETLLSIKDISFNDNARNERYYVTPSCIANIAYSPAGDCIIAFINGNREALDYYVEKTGCPLGQTVENFLGEILAA